MREIDSAQDSPVLTRRSRARAIAFFQAQRKRELDASLAVLNARRAAERNATILARLIALWPLWLGIFLALLSPAIEYVAKSAGHWCLAFVFPFVVLAQRPEIQVGPITHWLPSIMLYIQFPLEGLLARIVMRRNIHPLGVVWHVLTFHFLGIAELWMLNGAGQFFMKY
jgi:hypothetical protein